MIKQFTKLLCGLVLLISGVAKSQTNIAAYRLTKTTGNTYTPLAGDVAIFTGTWDSEVSGALPLGGTFTYGGTPYTTCYVSANGHLDFGASSTTTTPLSSTAATLLGSVAAFAQDGANSTVTGSTPKVSYASVGSEFVVQFQDHANYFNRAQERLNFQIRLNLLTNEIKIVYGTCTNPGTTTTSGTSVQVGLRGNTSTWATNVNNLMIGNVPTGTTCNWTDAVTGNANSSTLLFSGTTNVNVNIPTGLTYTWSPASTPLPVRTFYAVTNITTSSATITWAPAVGATQYNVQYRVPGSCSWTNFSGSPVSDTTTTITGLIAGISYQVRVQSVSAAGNAIWSHIPTSAAGAGLNGYTTTGTFTTVASCQVPTGVTINSITTTSASVSFTSTGNSFIIEYGANGFTPGTGATAGTGGTIVSGTTSPIILNGLSSGTVYNVYVRQNCTGSGNGYSTNSAVTSFSTNCTVGTVPYTENFDAVTAPALPPCIIVEDVNGASTWATYATTFTGSSSPNVMRYLYSSTTAADDWFFVKGLTLTAGTTYQLSFKYTGSSTSFPEKLEVRVGTSSTSTSALAGTQIFNNASITTVGDGTGTFTPTTTGVYYFGFHVYSLADQNYLYIDNINIDVAPACPVPTAVSVGSITANSVSVSFTSTSNNFIIEYGATGFTPGTGATAGTGGTIITGTSSPIAITGLNASTTYQFYIRQNCTAAGNGYSANSAAISFTTSPVCTSNISPADRANNVAIPFTLSWNAVAGATSYDVYFGTDPAALPNIGNVTSTSTSVTNTTYNTTYYWYVAPKNAGGANTGCQSTTTRFTTTAPPPPPPNDACANAIDLTVSSGFCSSPVLGTLTGADSTNGLGTASCQSNALKFDVWYKVTVPASGKVTIQTSAVNTTVTDLVMQAYSGTCSSLTAIGCDDDGNPDPSPSSLHPRLGLTGRTPGEIVYIRIMPYSTTTNAGAFAICAFDTSATVLPAIASGTPNTCNAAVSTNTDSAWKYTWVPIKDATGNIIAEVYPNGNILGSLSASYYRNTGPVRSAWGYYLDRNFTITPANQPGSTRPSVRLYFTDAELTTFATAVGATTRAQLMITKNADPCSSAFSLNGKVDLGALNASAAYGANHYIEDSVSSFSSFFIHRTGTVLPITLEYLKGLKAGTGNALNWKVNCTSVSITMELERSSDSRSFKSITSITATQARCGQPFDYTDATPLKGTNYYRLKMIDVDGSVTYSSIVAIINGSTGAELVGIYPTVVRDEAFLSIAASRSAKMQINISDMSGKVIRTISQTVANGSSLININTANLATGVYNITGLLDGMQTKTLRFVKQ